MSNNQITQLFSINQEGRFKKAEENNMTIQLWGSLANEFNINAEDILFPRIHAVKWTDKKALEIELTGSTEEGKNIKKHL